MLNAYFDPDAFYRALDGVRQQRGASWRQVFHATGLSVVYPTRFRQYRRHGWKWNADSLALLCVWAGLSFNDFIVQGGAR